MRKSSNASRAARIESIGRWVVPLAILVLSVWLWDRICIWNEIPHYILPQARGLCSRRCLLDWGDPVSIALLNTLKITFGALFIATLGGLGLAVLFTQSKWIEISFFPVRGHPAGHTDHRHRAADPDLCGFAHRGPADLCLDRGVLPDPLQHDFWGLNSADHNLRNLFQLYGASRWQTLRYLRLPACHAVFSRRP
jgi:NitT/TauT family transport system permease protein